MGWFWGASDDKDGKKSQDPLRDLDPSLREFLKKEAPVQCSSSNPPAAVQERVKPAEPTPVDLNAPVVEKAPAPVPTQFKDGRYDHIWATYRSQRDIEDESKTDQDKITDILEGFKQRRYEIGKAALENCTLEQDAVDNCWKNGGMMDKMSMCRTENASLRRCHEMQSVRNIRIYVGIGWADHWL